MGDPSEKSTILDSFVAEVRSYLPRIKADIEGLVAGPMQNGLIEESHRLARTIRASSLLMGYADLSRVVQPMEAFLSGVTSGRAKLGNEAAAAIYRSLVRTSTILDGLQGEWIDDQRVLEENDNDFKKLHEHVEPSREANPGATLGDRSQALGVAGQSLIATSDRCSSSESVEEVSTSVVGWPVWGDEQDHLALDEQGDSDEAVGSTGVLSWEQVETILALTTLDEQEDGDEGETPAPDLSSQMQPADGPLVPEICEDTRGYLLDAEVSAPGDPSSGLTCKGSSAIEAAAPSSRSAGNALNRSSVSFKSNCRWPTGPSANCWISSPRP